MEKVPLEIQIEMARVATKTAMFLRDLKEQGYTLKRDHGSIRERYTLYRDGGYYVIMDLLDSDAPEVLG